MRDYRLLPIVVLVFILVAAASFAVFVGMKPKVQAPPVPAPARAPAPATPSPAAEAPAERAAQAPSSEEAGGEKPPAAPAVTRKVVLKVELGDRRKDEGGFDVAAAIKEKLAASGVDVVEAGAGTADGTVAVSYSERRGEAYGLFPGSVMFYGVVIECSIRVLGSSGAEVMPLVELSGETPSTVSMGDQYDSAVRSLKADARFENLGDLVAAGLGERSSAARLVPLLLDDGVKDSVAKVLAAGGYELDAPREEAYLAVATGNFDRCVELGAPAVEALVRFADLDSGRGWDDRAKAAKALGKINDPRGRRMLRRLLAAAVENDSSEDVPDGFEDAAVGIIEAAGAVGSEFDIPAMQSLSESSRQAVADAAGGVLEKLWEPLVASPQSEEEAGQEIAPKVIMRARTEPWRKEEPKPVLDAVKAQLAAAKVTVVPERSETADGYVLVEASEPGWEGPGAPGASGAGGLLTCSVHVLCTETKQAHRLMELTSKLPFTDTPSQGELYSNLLEEMKASDDFGILGHWAATALGRRSAASKLMPHILDAGMKDRLVGFLDGIGYEPQSPSDKAYFAVARGEYDACVEIGKPAVAPLTKVIADPPGEDSAEMMKVTAEVAGILGQLGDAAASKPLRLALRGLGPRTAAEEGEGAFSSQSESGEEEAAAAVAVIEALAKVGDEFALAEVSRFTSDTRETVAEAAKAAKAELQARLKRGGRG